MHSVVSVGVAINLPTMNVHHLRHERLFYFRGEWFKQLPLTNDPRHSDDAGSAARAADEYKS